MAKSLIIVESPTKVKTIKKYMGPNFSIIASVGHIKDLPKSRLGIDVQNDFKPTYQILEAKKKVIADMKKAAKEADHIYLAPDPDREGEAIAWHIAEEIGSKNKAVHRVLFNDLTKQTIMAAINNPLDLNFNKYEAQQTRRILDRLVGYQISPILWEKVRRGLSAGRVQSVAVRIICDREKEIQSFVPEEYWLITALLEGGNPPSFDARLLKINGKKAKITNAAQAEDITRSLEKSSFAVSRIEKKEVKKNPYPPFTTSKLQQEAARWFRFSAKKTMTIAQKLYEGVELGKEGSVGLITYMRTDSVRISDEALQEARNYIRDNYSSAYLPAKARYYKNSKNTQDAHEAVRPTSINYKPADIKSYLTSEQFRLYQLIWNRFISSQMNSAVYDQTTIDVAAGDCLFRAQGEVMRFPGFTVIYTEGKEDNGNGEARDSGKTLPLLSENEPLNLLSLKPEQKFTQPPPRFSEASLVRELEEKGIGRPSTYAAILSTIQEREYVRLEKGRFFPTELGSLVTDLLVSNFPRILDLTFTASMETQLDMIEEGGAARLATLNNFYRPFEEELNRAKKEMRNIKREEISTDLSCEKCQSPMVIKWGKNGSFLACSNYPACKNTRDIAAPADDQKPEAQGNGAEQIKCDKCGSDMVMKHGRYGKFIACSGYPQCKNTMNLNNTGADKAVGEETAASDAVCKKCGKSMVIKNGRFGKFLACSDYPNCKTTQSVSMGIKCPVEKCGGEICEKKSKRGRIFFGCSRYPRCNFSTWDRPLPEPCPRCGAPFLVQKQSTKAGEYKACANKECGYKS